MKEDVLKAVYVELNKLTIIVRFGVLFLTC